MSLDVSYPSKNPIFSSYAVSGIWIAPQLNKQRPKKIDLETQNQDKLFANSE